MKISSFIMSIFIFVGLSAGLYSYYYDFVTPYSNAGLTVAPSASIFSSYTSSSLASIHNTVNQISNVILNVNPNANFGSVIIGMGVLFLQVIVWMIKLPMLIISVIADLMNVSWIIIAIPNWFKIMIDAIVLAYIVFRLASVVLGGKDL